MFVGLGKIEGKVDAVAKQVNGSFAAMTEHIRTSDKFRKQVTVNQVWIVIYRWLLGIILIGGLSLWIYFLKAVLLNGRP